MKVSGMKSVAIFFVVLYAVFIAAVKWPHLGFYLFIAVVIGLLIFKFGKIKRSKLSVMDGPERHHGWKVGRIGKAVKAVRRKEMTVAEASVHFNVTERSIRALHYLDTD